MKAKPDCIVCVFRQALGAARLACDNPAQHLRVMQEVARWVAQTDLERTPASLSRPLYATVTGITGNPDPYHAIKAESNRIALELLPSIRARIAASPDPLQTAIHAAAAGNLIDLGIGHAFDIAKDIPAMLDQPFKLNAIEEFRKELGPGRKLVYLGDNAGEIVFDMPLVEAILKTGTTVTFTVKSGPIINDATLEDAHAVGLTDRVPVIGTGSNDIGVDWTRVSGEFLDAVRQADVLVSKGHGNFETCNERPENFYFLLKAKCAMVADALNVRLGDLVFAHPSHPRA